MTDSSSFNHFPSERFPALELPRAIPFGTAEGAVDPLYRGEEEEVRSAPETQSL